VIYGIASIWVVSLYSRTPLNCHLATCSVCLMIKTAIIIKDALIREAEIVISIHPPTAKFEPLDPEKRRAAESIKGTEVFASRSQVPSTIP